LVENYHRAAWPLLYSFDEEIKSLTGVSTEMNATRPAADFPFLDRDCALILGGPSQRVNAIALALKPHFRIVNTAAGLSRPENGEAVGLVVVTDEIDPPPDRRFAKKLRLIFPQAKVLGIFDDFDTDVEIAMRGVGIVFWGSHERFDTHCEKILQTVLHNKVVADAAFGAHA
jgi:hypothetical protein